MTTMTRDLTDEIATRAERTGYAAQLDRAEVLKAIRVALKRRTGRTWSVTGGRGTGWGWLSIQSPPKRRTGIHIKNPDWDPDPSQRFAPGNREYILVDSGEPQEFGYMTPDDIAVLGEALGLERVHEQGVSIPSGGAYWEEYVARAEGRAIREFGTPYWD